MQSVVVSGNILADLEAAVGFIRYKDSKVAFYNIAYCIKTFILCVLQHNKWLLP